MDLRTISKYPSQNVMPSCGLFFYIILLGKILVWGLYVFLNLFSWLKSTLLLLFKAKLKAWYVCVVLSAVFTAISYIRINANRFSKKPFSLIHVSGLSVFKLHVAAQSGDHITWNHCMSLSLPAQNNKLIYILTKKMKATSGWRLVRVLD